MQRPTWQSELVWHCSPLAHGAHVGPPQSTSVSAPFWMLSAQDGSMQAPASQLDPGGQIEPHAPQLDELVIRSTQTLPQLVSPGPHAGSSSKSTSTLALPFFFITS